MKDPIYVVDPASKQTVQVGPTTFADLNVKERQDLQAWLMNRPEVLGEPLLLITSEFDRFDKSDRRLDLLLLDRDATLVIAELKLDVAGTLADQQAIRYAAFCSTMTMADVVELYERSAGKSYEEAVDGICGFLGTGELPELKGEPRVMLVAGTFADQELTTTVMWLRKFGLDISCIELTPYRYPGDDCNILLVPKILIPLAEAREYQISVERKERSEIARQTRNGFSEFFNLVLVAYAKLNPEVKGPSNPATQDYMSLHIGHGQVHYEWLVRRRAKCVDVALHFEAGDQATNLRRLEDVLNAIPELATQFTFSSIQGEWGKRWAHFCIRIPYQGAMPGAAEAEQAGQVMKDLVDRTLTVVRSLH